MRKPQTVTVDFSQLSCARLTKKKMFRWSRKNWHYFCSSTKPRKRPYDNHWALLMSHLKSIVLDMDNDFYEITNTNPRYDLRPSEVQKSVTLTIYTEIDIQYLTITTELDRCMHSLNLLQSKGSISAEIADEFCTKWNNYIADFRMKKCLPEDEYVRCRDRSKKRVAKFQRSREVAISH